MRYLRERRSQVVVPIYIYIYIVPSQKIDPRRFWGVKIKFMNKPPDEGGQYFATLFSGIFSSVRGVGEFSRHFDISKNLGDEGLGQLSDIQC
eukprot:jgi/Botrbrau1/19724/Bobra.0003s0084.1